MKKYFLVVGLSLIFTVSAAQAEFRHVQMTVFGMD